MSHPFVSLDARFIRDMGTNMERTLPTLLSEPDEYSVAVRMEPGNV